MICQVGEKVAIGSITDSQFIKRRDNIKQESPSVFNFHNKELDGKKIMELIVICRT